MAAIHNRFVCGVQHYAHELASKDKWRSEVGEFGWGEGGGSACVAPFSPCICAETLVGHPVLALKPRALFDPHSCCQLWFLPQPMRNDHFVTVPVREKA